MTSESHDRLLERKGNPQGSSEDLDADLVKYTREGDRHAFGVLVSRHQSAVTAVAYAICGDFYQSEDIAQESFVAAWKQLSELLNPSQFRAWVCGIARLQSLNHVRRRSRRKEKGVSAQPSEHQINSEQSENPNPRDVTVSDEEKLLIWHALELLPLNYREVLALYYREENSIAAVASALNLTEDTVKQRLSRGRLLLREKLNRMLEVGLAQSGPGVEFTTSVLAALPSITTIGGVSAATGLGSAGGKATGLFGSLYLSIASVVSGVISVLGLYLMVQYFRKAKVSPHFQKALIRSALEQVFTTIIFLAATGLAIYTTTTQGRMHFEVPPYWFLFIGGIWLLTATGCFIKSFRHLKMLAKEDPLPAWMPPPSFCYQWESRIHFLGLPLLSVSTGQQYTRRKKSTIRHARGWIAIGDIAKGGLFAMGGVAIAPISVGGIAVGVLSLGGIAFGGIGIGAMAIGFISTAGIALGWAFAIGGMAIGHDLVCGAIAVGGQAAVGVIVHAPVTGAEAWSQFQGNRIATTILSLLPHAGWLSLISLPSILIALRKLKD